MCIDYVAIPRPTLPLPNKLANVVTDEVSQVLISPYVAIAFVLLYTHVWSAVL